MKYFLLSLLIVLGTTGCKKDVQTSDYFAFGTAANFCLDDCAHFYKLAGERLYPDEMTKYTGKMKFSDTPLPDDKFQLAQPLEATFPGYLESRPDTTFGCPDCHDQGGYHIERRKNGRTEAWHFDTDVNQQPEEVRPYLQEMASILSKLK